MAGIGYIIKRKGINARVGGWKEVLVKGNLKEEVWYPVNKAPLNPITFPTEKEAETKVENIKDVKHFYRVYEVEIRI